MNYVKQVAENKDGCHVGRGPLCTPSEFKDMGEDYYRALVAYNKMTRWNMFYNNTDCVKKILNSEFWDAVDAIDEADDDDDKFGLYLFLGVAIGAVVVIAILLLVIYLKKSKTDDEETSGEEPLKVTP